LNGVQYSTELSGEPLCSYNVSKSEQTFSTNIPIGLHVAYEVFSLHSFLLYQASAWSITDEQINDYVQKPLFTHSPVCPMK